MEPSTKQDGGRSLTYYEAGRLFGIIKGTTSDKTHHIYRSDLRGNQDVFLIDMRRSPEFVAIEQKYLKNVFMGIYGLLKRVEGDDDNARKVYACADEISETFKISKKNALRLLLTANVPAVYGTRYEYLELFGSVSDKLRKTTDMALVDGVLRIFFSNFTVKQYGKGKEQRCEITHKLKEPWAGFLNSNDFSCGRDDWT